MKRFTTLLATGALALALAGCGDDPEPVADDPGTGETSDGKPTDDPSDGPDSTEGSEPPADTATVPVYFVGTTPQGPRLFREFRRVEADNPLAEAAALMTAGDVADRDYRTLYPSGTFTSVDDRRRHVHRRAARRLVEDAHPGHVGGRGPARRAAARLHGAGSPAGARSAVVRLDGTSTTCSVSTPPAARTQRRSSTYSAWSTSPPPRRRDGQRHVHRRGRLQLLRGHHAVGDPPGRRPSSRTASPPPRAGSTSSTRGRPRSTCPTCPPATTRSSR